MNVVEPPYKRNQLLATLPLDDYKALTEHATIILLKYGKKLYLEDAPIDSAYFPLNCVVAMLVGISDSAKVEMATVGNEGMVGFTTLLDVRRAIGDNVVQVPGDAVRLDAAILGKASNARPGVRQ